MTATRAGVLGVVLLAAALAPGAARAADVTEVVAGVRVAAPTCPIVPLSFPAFVDALRVELAGRARAHGATLVTLTVSPCDTATASVDVSVSDGASGRGYARAIGLEDVSPTARPRALALAVAELVRAAEPSSEASAPAPSLVVAAPAPPPPAPSPLALVVAADAVVGVFPARGTTLWGARLGATGEHARSHVGAFVDAMTGDESFPEGSVKLQWIGLGLVAGPRWSFGRLTLAPALEGAVAWAHIEGRAGGPLVTARSGDAPVAAVRARVLLSWALGRAVTARAFVEGGWQVAAFDATVDGARAAGLSGASVLGGLGLGFAP